MATPKMNNLLRDAKDSTCLFDVHFSTALFSALEHTHCALVVCDSEWETVAFYSGVLTMLFGCYMALDSLDIFSLLKCLCNQRKNRLLAKFSML